MNYHDTDQNTSGQEPLKPVFRKEYLALKAEKERGQAKEKKAAADAAAKLSNPAEYPIDALMPTLAGAVMAIAHEAQCPLEMAANCALGYASLAASGAANVQMPKGGLVPPAVYAVTVAESAEGKTRANRFACAPIEEREADLAKTHKADTTAHKSRHAAWGSMRDQAMKDKRLGTIEKKMAAIASLGSEPVAPRLPTLLLKDSTPEAIVRGFATMQPALGLFNSEGSQFLNGHGFTPENKLKTAALLADTWSGEEISQDRIGRGFSRISNPRLAIHMLVQPKAAKAFLSDEILYDQGLLPRILVAYPKSLIGTCVAVDEKSPPWVEQAHGAYCRQVLTLLKSWKTTIDGGEQELRTLVMAQGARKAWFSWILLKNSNFSPDHNLEDRWQPRWKIP